MQLWYLGKKYPLEFRPNKKSIIEFENKFYIASSNSQISRRYLQSWYKHQARKIIQERVALFSKLSGQAYNTISISDAASRWGSASSHKNLRFNWRLVMAPLPVIDYVVSHELAHLSEMNHSRKFWDSVRKTFPLYRQYRTWLKRNGKTLKI